MILTNDPGQNLQMVKLLCLRAFPGQQVLAEISAAQAILESRLSGIPSLLASKYNNLFGIKGTGTHKPPSTWLETQEYSNHSGWLDVQQGFAWNNCVEDSIQQHSELLNHPRYLRVKEAKDFCTAAQALVDAGYATDPSYARQLVKIQIQYLGDMK